MGDGRLFVRGHVAGPVVAIGYLAIGVLAGRRARAGDPEQHFLPTRARPEPMSVTGCEAAGTPQALPDAPLTGDRVNRALPFQRNAVAGPNHDTETPEDQDEESQAVDHSVRIEPASCRRCSAG